MLLLEPLRDADVRTASSLMRQDVSECPRDGARGGTAGEAETGIERDHERVPAEPQRWTRTLHDHHGRDVFHEGFALRAAAAETFDAARGVLHCVECKGARQRILVERVPVRRELP